MAVEQAQDGFEGYWGEMPIYTIGELYESLTVPEAPDYMHRSV